jgi:thioredoxin-like negative regulator of GroEL
MIAPVIEELARKAKGKVVFLKVDVDEARELAGFQGVKSMPTIHFFRNGKRVDTIVGANVPALREKVGRAMAPALLRSLTAERVLIPGLAAYLLLPRLFKDKASIPFWQMFLAS